MIINLRSIFACLYFFLVQTILISSSYAGYLVIGGIDYDEDNILFMNFLDSNIFKDESEWKTTYMQKLEKASQLLNSDIVKLEKSGSEYCSKVKKISVDEREYLGRKYKIDVLTIKFVRAIFVTPRKLIVKQYNPFNAYGFPRGEGGYLFRWRNGDNVINQKIDDIQMAKFKEYFESKLYERQPSILDGYKNKGFYPCRVTLYSSIGPIDYDQSE